jgi:hypothetical protein
MTGNRLRHVSFLRIHTGFLEVGQSGAAPPSINLGTPRTEYFIPPISTTDLGGLLTLLGRPGACRGSISLPLMAPLLFPSSGAINRCAFLSLPSRQPAQRSSTAPISYPRRLMVRRASAPSSPSRGSATMGRAPRPLLLPRYPVPTSSQGD